MENKSLVNHKFHIFLSVVTLGLWIPIYATIYFFRKMSGAPGVDLVEKKGQKVAAKEQRRQEIVAKMASKRRTQQWKDENKPKLGYTRGNNLIGSHPYVLDCSHQIRARKGTGLFSKGMLGKTVWCEICKANRRVTSTSYWLE